MSLAQENVIGFKVYAPAVRGVDDRPVAIIHAMERAFPNLRLQWRISDEGQPIPLPDRDAWVTRGRADGPGLPLLCNGDESYPVTISGWEGPASSASGGLPQLEIHSHVPLEAAAIAAAAN